MNGNEYKTVTDFEASLAVGTAVVVRWTNCNCYYTGKGNVSKINAKSIRVTLTEEVPSQLGMGYRPYAIGREIVAPRLADKTTWSFNNRVEPIGGYKPAAPTEPPPPTVEIAKPAPEETQAEEARRRIEQRMAADNAYIDNYLKANLLDQGEAGKQMLAKVLSDYRTVFVGNLDKLRMVLEQIYEAAGAFHAAVVTHLDQRADKP